MTAVATWALRAVWATLPLTAGPALADALDGTSDAFATSVAVLLWLTWVAVLSASLVPRTATLAPVRIAAAAAPVAAGWAVVVGPGASVAGIVALAATVLVAALALTAGVGEAFVDGDSYGNERRLPLRPPGPLLLGPIPLAWAVTVAGLAAGPLLLAAQAWIAGIGALVVGWPAAFLAGRALHGLARRTLILVPGGVVVHDPSALNEPVLLRKGVTHLALAPADTDALDLTQRALGPALEARLDEPAVLSRLRPRQQPQEVRTRALLVAPTRPGATLAAVRERGLAST